MHTKPTNTTHTYVAVTFTSLLFQLAVFTLGWLAAYACKKFHLFMYHSFMLLIPAFTGHLVSLK